MSLAWTLTWNLAPPSPSTTVQVFQFLMTTFNPNYLSVSDHVCTTFGKIQVQLCSLLFFFKSTSLFNNRFCPVPTAQSSSLYTCSSWRGANLCHLATTSSFTFNFTQDCVFHLDLMQYIFIHFYSLSRGNERFTILAKCS